MNERNRLDLWTIGHSTRSIDDFVALLKQNRIAVLVDIRTIPFSRHNPQFNQESLAASLSAEGIQYTHMPMLGGRRRPRTDSTNTGWKNMSFRGYADYMQTQAFEQGLGELIQQGRACRTAIMCAEAVPWRCHRSLVADALIARGWTVKDILAADEPRPHRLPAWAKVKDGHVTYPGQEEKLPGF